MGSDPIIRHSRASFGERGLDENRTRRHSPSLEVEVRAQDFWFRCGYAVFCLEEE